MKKILFAAVMLLCLGSLSTSCSKSIKLDDRLVGTKWQCEDYVHHLFYGGNCYQVYEFVSTTEVERYTTRNGNVDSSDGTFTYTLNYPHITINVKNSDGATEPTAYTFEDSRTMVRDGTNGSGYYAKYMKQ